MKRLPFYIASIALFTLAGCAKDDNLRAEGLTLGAGDAIAVNSALQIIDPWPEGVEDTELLVPSDRGSAAVATPAASGSGSTATGSASTGATE